MKEIKDNTNKLKDILRSIERLDIKMAIFLKLMKIQCNHYKVQMPFLHK